MIMLETCKILLYYSPSVYGHKDICSLRLCVDQRIPCLCVNTYYGDEMGETPIDIRSNLLS